MSVRSAARAEVKARVATIARMNSVTYRAVMARRPDISAMPEWAVMTSEEDSQPASEDDLDRFLTVDVVVRRKGDSAPDDLDLDVDALEAVLLPALRQVEGVETCETQRVRWEFDAEGATAIGQATLQMQVFYYAPRIGA